MTALTPQQPVNGAGPARVARWWWFVLAGLAYAGLTVLALPQFNLWFLTWLAPLPLALPALAAPGRARAALLAGLGTLPLWLYELTYINAMTGAGYVPLCVYLALFSAMFCWALGVCRRDLPRVPLCVIFPVLWTGVEILRCEVVLGGYPWFQLAQALIEVPLLASPARFGGEYFVSFLVALVAGSLLDVAVSRPRFGRGAAGFAAGALVFGLSAAAALRTRGDSGRVLRAGLVQTNLPQSNKIGWTIEQRVRDMAAWSALAREAAAFRPAPDVIVWPETMFPGFFLDPPAVRTLRENGVAMTLRRADGGGERVSIAGFAEQLMGLSLEVGSPMLVGGIGVENLRLDPREGGTSLDFDSRYNSVFLVRDGRVDQPRYDKVALTPFGEYMPLVGRSKWLQERLLALGGRGMKFDLRAGNDLRVFEVPVEGGGAARVVTPICFETAWAQHCRELVGHGGSRRADVMACLTNDGWFADSDRGREQHLQAARWRCLELGTPMIRAANTGVSAAIGADGRVISRGVVGRPDGFRVEGVLSVSVPIPSGETTYLRHGDLFRWPVVVSGCVLVAWAMVSRFSRRPHASVGQARVGQGSRDA